jgi:hypothetical protein
MKSLKSTLVILLALVFSLNSAQAQDEPVQELSLDKGSIASQFEYIYKKSGNYRADGRRYEVVRVIALDKLKQNVLDTLKVYADKEVELKTTIASQKSSIASLNDKLNETSNNLNSVTEEKDSMSFLGMLVSKVTYNTILWSTIACLLGLLLFFVYKFRQSNVLTQAAKESLSEVEVEFENHRRRALEREQVVNRKLQDELNKNRKTQ